jgi:16S rRNA processing protein RimM
MSSHPERFAGLREVVLFRAEGFPNGQRPFTVEQVWEHGSQLVFKFEGVGTISEAEQLRGAEVRVPAAERFALPEGEYYHSDLVGCETVDAASGERLGSVVAFREEGANGLLVVAKAGGGELLVPFTRAICLEIDIAGRRIAVDLPEGLLELND